MLGRTSLRSQVGYNMNWGISEPSHRIVEKFNDTDSSPTRSSEYSDPGEKLRFEVGDSRLVLH